jgi:chemotaxis signal transduction protein
VSDEEKVSLLLFRVGETRYGIDAAQVRRVERAREDVARLSSLGALAEGGRALVFEVEGKEVRVEVDAVLGLANASVSSLRRMPAAAGARPYAVGLWIEEGAPVLLLDLVKAIPELEARQ